MQVDIEGTSATTSNEISIAEEIPPEFETLESLEYLLYKLLKERKESKELEEKQEKTAQLWRNMTAMYDRVLLTVFLLTILVITVWFLTLQPTEESQKLY